MDLIPLNTDNTVTQPVDYMYDKVLVTILVKVLFL